MSLREWLLSLLFVAFFALKIAEGPLRLEEWPLTHAPMFEAPRPVEELPRRAKLIGFRGGEWIEMRPLFFGLNPAELEGRLLFAEDLAATCGQLVGQFNSRQKAKHRHFTEAYVSMRVIARPQAPEKGSETRTDCVLEEIPR